MAAIPSVLITGASSGIGATYAERFAWLFLSQGLSFELAPKGVYGQAALPVATRTEIWERAGADINALSAMIDIGELVDAALVGFGHRAPITIPPLRDAGQLDA